MWLMLPQGPHPRVLEGLEGPGLGWQAVGGVSWCSRSALSLLPAVCAVLGDAGLSHSELKGSPEQGVGQGGFLEEEAGPGLGSEPALVLSSPAPMP